MICTCPTTRAYPDHGAAHVPRGRLPAQRLRRVFGAPRWRASLTTAWQPNVKVLTCACPLASRAACRPHEPLVQSGLFRSSVAAAALASRSPRFFARSRSSESLRAAARATRPKNRLYTAGPGPDRDTQCAGFPPTDLSRGGPTCIGGARVGRVAGSLGSRGAKTWRPRRSRG